MTPKNLIEGKTVYTHVVGRSFRVTGLFGSDEEANAWMEGNPQDAVIANWGHLVVLADHNDMGELIR